MNEVQKINIDTWNSIYQEGRSLLIYPDETIVSFLKQNTKNIKSGFDIACGAGRHTFLMSDFGIKAKGIDSSIAAVRFANDKAKKERNKTVQFENSTISDFEVSEQVDLVIMWGLYHYLSKSDQVRSLEIIKDVLNEGGVFLGTIRSTKDSRFEGSKKISETNYLVDYFDKETNRPKQTIMQFFNEEQVVGLLEKHFKNIVLGHRCIEPIGKLGTKSCHWLIKAEKMET